MKINEHVISLPPYVSTSWENVVAMQIDEERGEECVLIIHLIDNIVVKIPKLNPQVIETIFVMHSRFVEKKQRENKKSTSSLDTSKLFSQASAFSFGFASPMQEDEGIAAVMQHNPSFANAPPLPKEMLRKIFTIASKLQKSDLLQPPQPYPHCNCFYCQIARAINYGLSAEADNEEECLIKEEDLKFRQWDILPRGEKVYTISPACNKDEQYTVYLGTPLFCTCGEKNCCHIKAVLET